MDLKVTDKVWFMNDNKPCNEEISAKIKLDGKLELSYQTIGKEGETEQVFYKVGYSIIPESKVFKTKEDLKNSLFN